MSGLASPTETWRAWWMSMSRVVGYPAAAQGFVLGLAQVAEAGVSRQRTRTRIKRGSWTATGYGTVAPLDISDPDPLVVARRRHALGSSARAFRREGNAVSGRSAAILYGLPTFAIPATPQLTAVSARAGVRVPAHTYAAGLPAGSVTRWHGAPVTTVARTLVDLGRHDRRDAIMAADAALRERLVCQADVDAALETARGWPGVRQARAVLALASPLAESPLESLTRLALHDDGFPVPELQVWIPGSPYRADMLLRDASLILEIDGLAKYTDEEVRREKRRTHRLRALGYRVERVTWDDVVRHWAETRVWLRAALQLPGRTG